MKKVLLALPLFFALNACALDQTQVQVWYEEHKGLSNDELMQAAIKDGLSQENIDWLRAQIAK